MVIYSLEKDGAEVPLLTVLDDLERYFNVNLFDTDEVAL